MALSHVPSGAAAVVPAADAVLAWKAVMARSDRGSKAAPTTNAARATGRHTTCCPRRVRQMSHRPAAAACPASNSQAL